MANPKELDEYIKGGKAIVWPKRFAVTKAEEANCNCFVVIQDQNEITLVVEEEKLDTVPVIEVERGWRMITFDMILPFGVVGFLARIAQALAEARVSIFALSAYSTDHILVKEDNLDKAVHALESLGLVVAEQEDM
ncbi:MAG: ACT domain-containing protein [Candidatus Thorarchaeota archaeon]|nr:ACT domain-containing protein [Candidatus Thorarchaeota archaeon]